MAVTTCPVCRHHRHEAKLCWGRVILGIFRCRCAHHTPWIEPPPLGTPSQHPSGPDPTRSIWAPYSEGGHVIRITLTRPTPDSPGSIRMDLIDQAGNPVPRA